MTTARDLLERKGGKVFTIGSDDTVLDAARRMARERIGALVVVDPAVGMLGIFTERDILSRVVAEGRRAERTLVGEVMSTRLAYCTLETPVAECQEMMTNRRVRHLPVIEHDELVGLISIGDLMAHEVLQQQVTIEYMHEYIYGRA